MALKSLGLSHQRPQNTSTQLIDGLNISRPILPMASKSLGSSHQWPHIFPMLATASKYVCYHDSR